MCLCACEVQLKLFVKVVCMKMKARMIHRIFRVVWYYEDVSGLRVKTKKPRRWISAVLMY